MKPKNFPEVNITFAKDQKEYNPLQGYLENSDEGRFYFCMGLSLIERLRVLYSGRIWCCLMTFKKPLTPSHFTTKKSDYFLTKKDLK